LQLESDLHTAFALILAPETPALQASSRIFVWLVGWGGGGGGCSVTVVAATRFCKYKPGGSSNVLGGSFPPNTHTH
jgi:hypothetical protein